MSDTHGTTHGAMAPLTRKDFVTDQEVRWGPGCGDYSILVQTQKVMPYLGVPRENIVFVSGIGCSSRLPYYMHTYGFHTIHSRAPAIATGLKVSRPALPAFPVPVGVLQAVQKPTYDAIVAEQEALALQRSGPGDLEQLFHSGETWVVE